jgi:hypothetical protein
VEHHVAPPPKIGPIEKGKQNDEENKLDLDAPGQNEGPGIESCTWSMAR